MFLQGMYSDFKDVYEGMFWDLYLNIFQKVFCFYVRIKWFKMEEYNLIFKLYKVRIIFGYIVVIVMEMYNLILEMKLVKKK